jgi:hypothetical protein
MYHRMALDSATRGDFEQRHVAAGIHGEEFRRAGFTLEDIDLDRLMRDVELRQREPHLVAIARAAHGIQRVHASSPRSRQHLSAIKE